MSTEPRSEPSGESEVMAAMDEAGSRRRFVIADITVEDAWLAAGTTSTVSLQQWR